MSFRVNRSKVETDQEIEQKQPGPGQYELDRNFYKDERKVQVGMGKKLNYLDTPEKHYRRTPAPNAYQTMESFNKAAGNGGTGKHSGFPIVFGSDERRLNQDIEKRSDMPGPGSYDPNRKLLNNSAMAKTTFGTSKRS